MSQEDKEFVASCDDAFALASSVAKRLFVLIGILWSPVAMILLVISRNHH